MASIQPCLGAPPEPLGDGTQASFQPSVKSVQIGSGLQQSGSGVPQIDSVAVAKNPISTRGDVGMQGGPGKYVDPGAVIGVGVASGAVTLSTISPTRAEGAPPGGNGGDAVCAGARPAHVTKAMASAAANRPPGKRGVWLPDIGLILVPIPQGGRVRRAGIDAPRQFLDSRAAYPCCLGARLLLTFGSEGVPLELVRSCR
jgi:hypothetical protein